MLRGNHEHRRERQGRRARRQHRARQVAPVAVAAADALDLGHLDVVLRVHGHELADGHAAGAGHEPRDARHEHRALGIVDGANADHEGGHGDEAVVGAQDGRAEPLCARYVVDAVAARAATTRLHVVVNVGRRRTDLFLLRLGGGLGCGVRGRVDVRAKVGGGSHGRNTPRV